MDGGTDGWMHGPTGGRMTSDRLLTVHCRDDHDEGWA